MITSILRKTYAPIQHIFYNLRRKRNIKKMMAYCLKINHNVPCAKSKNHKIYDYHHNRSSNRYEKFNP